MDFVLVYTPLGDLEVCCFGDEDGPVERFRDIDESVELVESYPSNIYFAVNFNTTI